MVSTHWGDLLLKNSTSQNYEVNVAGGSEKTNFNVSRCDVRPRSDEERPDEPLQR